MVLLTALGVGGATVIGAGIGFIFKNISHKFSDIVLSFAAGVMLAAAIFGLIVPSLEYGGEYKLLITIGGIFVGALVLYLIDKLVPHLHKISEPDIEPHKKTNIDKVMLFGRQDPQPRHRARAHPAGPQAAHAQALGSRSRKVSRWRCGHR